jgi:DNA-binding CsgD family transcriptional regulator
MSRTSALNPPRCLIGRDSEAQALRGALEAAGRGEPQIVVVAGEAGSGKTFLLHQVLDHCGPALCWGNTSEFANAEFGPVKDMLRRLRREFPVRFDAMRANHRVIAALLPELGCDVAPIASRDALFDAIGQMLLQLAGDGVAVLVFDDLHVADHATVELLAYLRDLMSDESMLLVTAHRSDDLPRLHPMRRLRQQWRRIDGVIELDLPALSAAQTSALAEARLGAPPSPALAADLLRWSGGLPLYVEELVETLVQRGAVQRNPEGLACAVDAALSVPESLRDSVMFRMAALEPETQRLLERAAVMGSDIDLDLLAAVAGDAERVEILFEAGWLGDADPGQARFRHALLREAVYGHIPWTRRRQWHAQCASALEAAGRSLDAITEHWLAAREHEHARMALLARAQRACDIHAHADALGHVVHALELWPEGVDEARRLDALFRLGDCAQLARRPDEAGRAWNELCDRAERCGDWTRVAQGRRRLAVLWAMAGEVERGVSEREAASGAFLRAGRQREAAVELCSAADALNLVARWTGILDLVARAWPLAVAAGDLELLVLLQSQRGRTLGRIGRVDEGLAEARAALDLAESKGLVSVIGSVYQRLADCHEHGSDYASAQATFLRGAQWCLANGQAMQREACRACALPVLTQNGEWPLGLRLADEVAADPHSPAWARATGIAFSAQLQVMRGEFRSARPRLQQALRAVREIGFRGAEASTLSALALCDWFDGKPLSALAHARDALKSWAQGEDVHHVVPTACLLSTMFAWEHDAAGVNACVHAASTAAQGTGQAEALAGLAYTMGESHVLAGRYAEAARELATALDLGRGLPLPFARASALRRLAEAESLLGQVGSASERLRGAIDLFDKLGAAPFLKEATLRLRALAPQSLTAADERREHAGLTPRQLQILRQVSRGCSDKEIARALGLSPRTVEMHVARLMATLCCRNRAEAVARAGELRLLGADSR